MIKYSNFLFSILVKKKTFYLIFIIFCLVFSGMFIAGGQSSTNEQILFPITTFTKWFPFVFSTIFTLVGVVRIFKVTEQDGTELLVSAKPVSRTQIIFAKFFALLVLIIVFQLLLFLFLWGIAQIDDNATATQRLKYAATLAVGGLITSLIMGSLIIIISSLIGRVGIIVIGIMFAACVPILSFVIVPFASAINPFTDREKSFNYLAETQTSAVDKIYDPAAQNTKLSKISFIPRYEKKHMEKNRTSWYQQAKFFDVWYQWNRFYSLLSPKVSKPRQWVYNIKHLKYDEISEAEFNSIYNEAQKTSISWYTLSGDNVPFAINTLFGFFSDQEVAFEKNFLPQAFNKVKYKNLTQVNGTLNQELRLLNEEFKVKYPSFNIRDINRNRLPAQEMVTFIENGLKNIFALKRAIPLKNYRILLWRAARDYQNNILQARDQSLYQSLNVQASNTIFEILFSSGAYGQTVINVNSYYDRTNNKFSFKQLSQDYFVVSNLTINQFLDTNLIIIFWSAIGFILLTTSVIIYAWRDFR